MATGVEGVLRESNLWEGYLYSQAIPAIHGQGTMSGMACLRGGREPEQKKRGFFWRGGECRRKPHKGPSAPKTW